MTGLILDASVLIRALAEAPDDEILRRRLARSRKLYAPSHVGVEVLNGIRGLVLSGKLTTDRAAQAVEDYLDLPIARYPVEQLMERAWILRHNFNAYDGSYVALAQELQLPILTLDRKIQAAAPADVEVDVYPTP